MSMKVVYAGMVLPCYCVLCTRLLCVVITLAACTGDAAQSYVVKCRVLGWEEGGNVYGSGDILV